MAACADDLRVMSRNLVARHLWVAGADRPPGCVGLTSGENDTAETGRFFVDPDAQRRGVARAGWARLVADAAALGVRHLSLHADPGAVAFYVAVGFAVTGQTPSGSIPDRMFPVMTRDPS